MGYISPPFFLFLRIKNTVHNSAFYIKYKEMDIYFIFEDRNDKISIKCTNKLVNNTKEYEYVSFVDDIETGIDDFIDSIQKQIERLLNVNELLNKNVKMLTDMIWSINIR